MKFLAIFTIIVLFAICAIAIPVPINDGNDVDLKLPALVSSFRNHELSLKWTFKNFPPEFESNIKKVVEMRLKRGRRRGFDFQHQLQNDDSVCMVTITGPNKFSKRPFGSPTYTCQYTLYGQPQSFKFKVDASGTISDVGPSLPPSGGGRRQTSVLVSTDPTHVTED